MSYIDFMHIMGYNPLHMRPLTELARKTLVLPETPTPRVNELLQVQDGMPAEIAIAQNAHDITGYLESEILRRSEKGSIQLGISDLIPSFALDAATSPGLSRRLGDNTYCTHIGDEHITRYVRILPPPTIAQRELVGIPQAIMVTTQVRSATGNTVEQTIFAQWTHPQDTKDKGVIYSGFHLQVRDHYDSGDLISIWQYSINPKNEQAYLMVPTLGHFHFGPRQVRATVDFEGNILEYPAS